MSSKPASSRSSSSNPSVISEESERQNSNSKTSVELESKMQELGKNFSAMHNARMNTGKDTKTLNQTNNKTSNEENKMIKTSYIVDQQDGPYFTIQSAIDAAVSGSIIKINSGLYKENLVIRGKSLTLEQRDMNSEVYVLGIKGPALLVEQDPQAKRNLQNAARDLKM